MNGSYDITIVGAGIVGLTAALKLQLISPADSIGLQVIDGGIRPTFDADGDVGLRVSAISAGSANLFAEMGVWEEIRQTRACPYREMCVWDADGLVDGPETLRFAAAEFALPQLGYIVENSLLQHALLAALDEFGVNVRFETPVRRLVRTASRYLLETGEGDISADLFVGADGASSVLRREAGIAVSGWRYPQSAVVTHLTPAIAHSNIAWQRFLRTGPIALLPLEDGRVSLVWSTNPEQAQEAMTLDDDALAALLTDATDGVLGNLEPAGPRGTFPLQAQHAEGYTQPGLALIGDAAHSVHPLAGQGANLGIADAVELAKVVAAALGQDENPGDMPVLRRFERARKGANQTMLHFVDTLNRLFALDSAPLSRARRTGMRLFNKSGPLRRKAVEVALGINAR